MTSKVRGLSQTILRGKNVPRQVDVHVIDRLRH